MTAAAEAAILTAMRRAATDGISLTLGGIADLTGLDLPVVREAVVTMHGEGRVTVRRVDGWITVYSLAAEEQPA